MRRLKQGFLIFFGLLFVAPMVFVTVGMLLTKP